MSQIVNLTPHPVVILDPGCAEYDSRTRSYKLTDDPAVVREFGPEGGNLPRVATQETELTPVDGMPLVQVQFGEIENLPEPEQETFLVVSAIVANAAKEQGRTDCLCPGRLVRDTDGKIVGCLALSKP